jgi:hypothetical protein
LEGNTEWTACPSLHTQAVGLARKRPPRPFRSHAYSTSSRKLPASRRGMCCRTVASANETLFDQVALLVEQAIGVPPPGRLATRRPERLFDDHKSREWRRGVPSTAFALAMSGLDRFTVIFEAEISRTCIDSGRLIRGVAYRFDPSNDTKHLKSTERQGACDSASRGLILDQNPQGNARCTRSMRTPGGDRH